MEKITSFTYTYCAKGNQEIQAIREKYLPQKESKFDELKRLDKLVQSSGARESLCLGIIGAAVFGMGFCFLIQVIGNGALGMIAGVVLSLIGIAGILLAYPVHRRLFLRAEKKYTPRILALAAELTGGKVEVSKT